MERMAPQSVQQDEVLLSSAVLCHIMILNSVLERTANRYAEEHGLTFPQWMAIGCIGHAGPEGITHSELGQKLMLSKAPITGLVDRLERGGFVNRVADTLDRRVSRVVMTEKGESVWREVRQSLRENSQELCACFSTEEQELLVSLLSRLLNTVASADPTLEKSQWLQCAQQHSAGCKAE
jgi:DNA-binding MarR family transcriptional regulator